MEEFIELFVESMEIEDREVKPEDSFRDFPEWDSLTQLTLIAMLDEHYGVEIEMAEFNTLITVGDLARAVEKHKKV
jgi:acyl carrier protein